MWKRLSVLWVAARGDARRLWYALGHPEAPLWLKAGTAALVLYVLSPVDLVPEVLLLLGVVDDLVLVPLALRWMLSRLPAPVLAHVEARVAGSQAQSPWNPLRR